MFAKLKNFTKSYEATGPIDFIIAGLGNPGKEYEATRHNAGFLAIEYIAAKHQIDIKRLRFRSLCGDAMFAGKRVLFMKPSTYMNLSGEAIKEAMDYYKIPIERVLVLCDDVTLDVGQVRVRRKGSDGGQNGLKNIIYLTGANTFPRIRIGIGAKPHPQMDLAAWVLSHFTKHDMETLGQLFPKVEEGAALIVANEIDKAMNLLN